MVDFIPFIPQGTPGVSDKLWNAALKTWNLNLTTLLNMQGKLFLEQVMSNTSVFSFIDQVLNEQMNNNSDPVDSTLLKNIFLLYNRLTSLPSLDITLLTMERLCSFVIVYGESNTRQVRDIMTSLINNSSSLEQSLLSTLGMLIDAIRSMPNLLSKSTTIDTLNRAYVLVRVLDALLSSTIHLDCIKDSFDTLDMVLIECYRDLIPCLKSAVDRDNSNASYAYLIKFSLVSTFNSFADIQFFIPLGYQSSITNHDQLEAYNSNTVQDTTLDLMSEKILGYIEESGLESSRSAFVDGPLIMDWEVEYHITDKLDYINQHTFEGEDERIEFLKLSMEQVRDSNAGTGSWGDLIPQKRQPNVVAKQKESGFDNVEKTSKISQIQDLFPHLGDGFIEACLDANNDDTETVIMQLLEDNLPQSVSKLDRSMERKSLMGVSDAVEQLKHLEGDAAAIDSAIEQQFNRDEEQESVLKSRRNVYDNDEFDIFAHRTVDTSKVYVGKKNKADADSLLDDKSFIQTEKKNVLQRVVDMYDDDYDDSYDDINDAGIPSTLENGDGDAALDVVKKKQEVVNPSIENESVLVHAFAKNPDLFVRNASVRKSKERDLLKKQTGMTDEQLKGWALMFNRNVSNYSFKYHYFTNYFVNIA